jgi:hypothetical protein
MISLEEHISVFFWNNLLATRDENIAETFRLFRGKMETEQNAVFPWNRHRSGISVSD